MRHLTIGIRVGFLHFLHFELKFHLFWNCTTLRVSLDVYEIKALKLFPWLTVLTCNLTLYKQFKHLKNNQEPTWQKQIHGEILENEIHSPTYQDEPQLDVFSDANKLMSNKPCSIYQYSNTALMLSGQTSIFGDVFFVSKSLLWIERQKKLKKFKILTQKHCSHVRILI